MANLTGKRINLTYKSLIKTLNNNTIGTNSVALSDGFGNTLPLFVSSSGFSFSGVVDFTNAVVIGAVGPTGPAGSAGSSGSSGSSGTSGVAGTSGSSGSSGVDGSSGSSGSSGTSGVAGTSGSSGSSGSSGTSGVSGSSGSSGTSGVAGTSGSSGSSGTSGVSGSSGSSGTSGVSPSQNLQQTLSLGNLTGTYSLRSTGLTSFGQIILPGSFTLSTKQELGIYLMDGENFVADPLSPGTQLGLNSSAGANQPFVGMQLKKNPRGVSLGVFGTNSSSTLYFEESSARITYNTTGGGSKEFLMSASSVKLSIPNKPGFVYVDSSNNLTATQSFSVGSVATETFTSSTHTWTININGQDYKVLLQQV